MRSGAFFTFAPMVSIQFFCLVRPKIQHSRSGAGSESGTFGPLGKKIFFLRVIFCAQKIIGIAKNYSVVLKSVQSACQNLVLVVFLAQNIIYFSD